MAQADSDNTTDAPTSPQESFAALAAGPHPAWHQAILRLANAAERVAGQLEWVCSHPQDNDPDGTYAGHCRELVDYLLEFLDGLDEDQEDLEPTLGQIWGGPNSDECEIEEDSEPSLGSFGRMMDQSKSWRIIDRNADLYGWTAGNDNELDDSDHEDSDPAELSEASGIGDADGVTEQVGRQDWQPIFSV